MVKVNVLLHVLLVLLRYYMADIHALYMFDGFTFTRISLPID